MKKGNFLIKNKKNFCYIWNKLQTDSDSISKRKKLNQSVSKYDFVKLSFGIEAKNALRLGLNKMQQAVGVTYGPLGQNFAISDDAEQPYVTKDGVTVAKNVRIKERLYNIGCRLISSISNTTNETAGDGTTTTTLLTALLINKGMSLIETGHCPVEIKKGLIEAQKDLLKYFEQNKTKIKTKKQLFELAMISTNGNKEISEIVSDAIIETGENGILDLEESPIGITKLKVNFGMSILNGFATEDFLGKDDQNMINFDNPLILLYPYKITSVEEIISPLEFAKSINRPLVIFAEGIKDEPLSILVYNKKKEICKNCAIKIPDYTDDYFNLELFKDIASVTGAKVCNNFELKDFDETVLGTAEKIHINEYETIIMGGDGTKEDIIERIKLIKEEYDKETDRTKIEVIKSRLSRMEGKSAVIYVGGFTEMEIVENRDKIVDSLNSCKTALNYGILPGGGNSYIYGLSLLQNKYKLNHNLGYKLLIDSFVELLGLLYKNTNTHPMMIIEKVQSNHTNYPYYGYNLNKNTFEENILSEGLIDSFNTVKICLEDSISLATVVMTTECIVYKEINYEPPPVDFFRTKFSRDMTVREEARKKFYDVDDT